MEVGIIFCENYCFADVSVKAQFNHEYMKNACQEYVTDKPAEITIAVLRKDVEKEKELARSNNDFTNYPEGYLEFLAFYRKFCDAVAEKGIILLHGCAVAVDEKAYIFTAPSGTGKTTHARLWLKELGDKAHILNGDKPLLRLEGETVFAYGTPWDGKEHMSRNEKLPLSCICLIERAVQSHMIELTADKKLEVLLSQVYRPQELDAMKAALTTMLSVVERIDFYHLFCDISSEAAKLSIKALTKEKL